MTIKLTRAIDFVLRGSLSVENAIGSLLEALLIIRKNWSQATLLGVLLGASCATLLRGPPRAKRIAVSCPD